MKELLTVLFLVSATLVKAQTELFPNQKSAITNSAKTTPFYPSTSKTTNASERVLAKVQYNYNGSEGIYDSVAFSWFGNKGSTQTGFPTFAPIIQNYDTYRSWIKKGAGLQKQYKTLCTFDEQNNLIENLNMIWDNLAEEYILRSRSTRKYSNKNCTEDTDEEWNSVLKKWEYSSLTLQRFDEQNILTERISKKWNTNTSSWENRELYFIVWDKNIEIATTANWNSITNSFLPKRRSLSTYTKGKITELIYEKMSENSLWEKELKAEYVNHGDYYDSVMIYDWSNSESEFKIRSKSIYTFEKEAIKEAINMQWYEKDGWIITSKYNYSPYTNKSLTREIASWNFQHHKWGDTSKTVFLFNQHDNLTEETHYIRKDDQWKLSSLQSAAKIKYYYEPTDVSNFIQKDIHPASLYPNPPNTANVYLDYFTEKAEASEIVLTNILGQELFRFSEKAAIGDHSVRIPVASLSPGLYLVSIYSKGALNQALKLVK